MELSSAIIEDYFRSLDSNKDRRKKGIAKQERDSQERVTESIQQKKGLVDGRQIKQSRVEITRHFVCLKDIQTVKMSK